MTRTAPFILWILVVVASLGVLVPSTANAQYNSAYGQVPNPLIDALMWQQIAKRSVGKIADAYDAKQGKPAAPAPTPTRAPLSATDFRRVDHRRPRVDTFLNNTVVTADQKAALEEFVESLFVVVAKELRKDNLATAMGFAIAAAVEVSTGRSVSMDEAKRIIADVNGVMVAAPEVKQMTPAQMQDLHDRLIMSAGFMLAFHSMKDPHFKALGGALAKQLIAQINGK